MNTKPRGAFDSRTTRYLRPDRPYICGNNSQPCSSGPTGSGVCPHGEAGCFPRMTEGYLRKRVQRSLFLLFLGGLMVTLAAGGDEKGPFDQELISPGPLSHFHSQFECSDCHSADLNSWQGLLSSVWDGSGDTFASDGCLKCHDQGPHAMSAHGASPEALRERSGLQGVAPFHDQTECAVCHTEHGHGSHDVQLSDSRCQTCHQQQFESFVSGHPPFSEDYGNKLRTLSFSHSDHALRHFKTMPEFAPQSCSGCHQLNGTSGAMTVLPYEESCGQCHTEDILKSEAVKFFALPTILGLEEMKEEGMGVGDWPYIDILDLTPWTRRWYQSSDMDTGFSELMKLSELEGDEPGNPAKVREVQEFAMSIKRSFMKDMISDLRSWIGRLLPGEYSEWTSDELAQLSGQFPIALLIKMQERWFPNLDEELNRFDSGMLVEPQASEENVTEETSAAAGSVAEEDDLLAGNEEDLLLEEEDDLLVDEDDLLMDEDDLLAEKEGLLAESEEDLLLEEDDLLSGDLDQGKDADKEEAIVQEHSLEETSVGRHWANLGGWYEDGGVVWYKPVQHADPFLKAWIEAEIRHGANEETSAEILSLLLADKGPGQCSKCHSGVSAEKGALNWAPAAREEPVRFSKFSHADHVFSDADLQCTSCHQPRESQSSSGHDWFPVKMESCTDCHGQEVADDCTLCHQYHASPGIRKLKSASVNIFRMSEEN